MRFVFTDMDTSLTRNEWSKHRLGVSGFDLAHPGLIALFADHASLPVHRVSGESPVYSLSVAVPRAKSAGEQFADPLANNVLIGKFSGVGTEGAFWHSISPDPVLPCGTLQIRQSACLWGRAR